MNTFNLPQSTQSERIAAWCAWFGYDLPALDYDADDGALLLTDPLMDWILQSGASLDWIAKGDAHGLAVAFHEKRQSERPFKEILAKLDGWEKDRLLTALRQAQGGDFRAALQSFEDDVRDRRRQNAEKIAGHENLIA